MIDHVNFSLGLLCWSVVSKVPGRFFQAVPRSYLVISESVLVSLKYESPVKALCLIVSCYKKNRFLLNLCKQIYCHENKYTHREFLNSGGIK